MVEDVEETQEDSDLVEAEDAGEFGANLSGLTSRKDIAVLELIRKQVSEKHHPLNVIASHFIKVVVGSLEQKSRLIDRLLTNPGTPLEKIIEESKEQKTDKVVKEKFVEKKFGSHLSTFVLQQNQMKALTRAKNNTRITKVKAQM